MRQALRRLDDAVAAVERFLVVSLLALMAVAVFLDAIHRLFSASEGRLERLLVALFPAVLEATVRRFVEPCVLAAATFGVAYGAARSVEGLRRPERRTALVLAAGATVAAIGSTQLLVQALPNGLVWSQQMALCFMLWVGLIGASLGARDRAHIVFEMAGKVWPRRARRFVDWAARVVAAGFSLFLALLAVGYAQENFSEWSESAGAAGLFEGFRVPRFVIYGFLPLPLAVMGLRFLGHGVSGGEPLAPPAPSGAEAIDTAAGGR